MISEKQLSNLILKQQVSDDLEYDHVSDADPSKDDFVIGQVPTTAQEIGEQDSEPSISTAGSSSSSSSDDYGTSMGADEYPAYPDRPKWGDKGQTPKRGAANSIATGDKWGDHDQKPVGGPANQSF